jgi:chitodextrinase
MKNFPNTSKRWLAGFILISTVAVSQTQQEIQTIQKQTNLETLQTLSKEFQKRYEAEKTEAIRIAKLKNWPLEIKDKDGYGYASIAKVVEGKPVYLATTNDDAAVSTRVNFLNSGGGLNLNLNGENMKAHVWDGGVGRTTHQEYDGPGGNNRLINSDGGSLSNHAAHVSGTIMASGFNSSAKGMAPQAKVYGYDWNSDLSEASTAAQNGMLLSNHSYGWRVRDNSGNPTLPNYYFGAYLYESYSWDNLMYNAPFYLMVVSAGNNGNDNTVNGAPLNGNGFYDKLTGHAVCKNNLVVANAHDANIDANGNLVSCTINGSSSEGPTDDLRIKPDITGNGTGLYSSTANSNSSYASYTGTSMSSPNVTGSLLLLQQHYNNNNSAYMKASTLKGLALHTADDLGPTGPDAVYGWGLLNTKKAVETIDANGTNSLVQELTLSNNQSYSFNVNAQAGQDLMASICWTDKPGQTNTGQINASTPRLVHDLDIRISKNGTTYLPYKLTSPTSNALMDNNVDPFERIAVAGASGTYTITITHKGTLTSNQNYSLVVTGITIPSTPVCTAVIPSGVQSSNITTSSADIDWTALPNPTNDLDYTVRYSIAGTNNWTEVNTANNQYTLNGLDDNTTYNYQVRSNCPTTNSNYSSVANFTTLALPDTIAPSIPSNLQAQNITYHSANVSWNASTDNVGVSGYKVYVDGALLTTTVNTSIQLSNLDDLTSYAVKIKAFDAANNHSSFSSEINFNTLQAPDTISPSIPSNVSVTNIQWHTADVSWDASTDNDAVDNYDVYLNNNFVASTANTSYSLSNLSGASTYTVKVLARDLTGNTSNLSSGENFTTPQAPDTIAPTMPMGIVANSITQTTATINWNNSTDNIAVTGYKVYLNNSLHNTVSTNSINLTGLSATTSYTVGVQAFDAAGNYSAINSTNFSTIDWPDTIAPTTPTNLAVSGITHNSADLTWDASTDNVQVTAYDIYLDGNYHSSSSTNNTVLTGLSAATSYTVSVKAKDAAGNESGTSNIENFTTEDPQIEYCSSQGNNQNYEFIKLVGLNQINNLTSSDNGYGDYTNLIATAYKGSNQTMSIQAGFTSGNYQEKWRVWIDLNQDGNFSNNEMMAQKNTTNSNVNTMNFTIPASAMTGETRMRVSMKYGSYPSACGNFTYGEVEDYTINIIEDTEAPSIPMNLSVSNITSTTAMANWNASNDNVSSNITYKVYYDNGSFIGSTNNTSLLLSGLTANTNYSIYVVAEDESGNSSDDSDVEDFTTEGVEYCTSKGNNQNYEFIDYIGIKEIQNTTGSNNGYGDFTAQIATVSPGEQVEMVISAGFVYSNYNERWRVWIDYNQNGVFENNEKVVQGVTYNGGNYTKSFTVPANVALGTTRMRVVMKYGSYPNPCGNYTWGETEDYTIEITENGSSNIVSNSTNSSAEELLDKAENISVYPNPATDIIQVSDFNFTQYSIVDYTGKTILTGSKEKEINISSLTSGAYIIVLKNERLQKQIPFVKR